MPLESSVLARENGVATSARKHTKLLGLSPGSCGSASPSHLEYLK